MYSKRTGKRVWVLSLAAVMLAMAGPRTGLEPRSATEAEIAALVNPSFEGGWTRDTRWWTPTSGPNGGSFGEIFTPEGWETWWLEGFPEPGEPDERVTGRPEVKVISLADGFPDATRVRSGDQAVQLFTFWRAHDMGLVQRVAVEPGKTYRFSVYAHAFYSQCSGKWHHPVPLETDCETAIGWAHTWLSVGIDPTTDNADRDPRAGTVVWSEEREVYGAYADEPLLVEVVAEGDYVTVFMRSWTTHALKHCDVYVDDAKLEVVGDPRPYRLHLPLVLRDATTYPPEHCVEGIANGGFEADSGWEMPSTPYPAAYTTELVRSGNRSMRTGIVDPDDNRESWSSARQLVAVPAGAVSATLRLWFYPISGESPMDLALQSQPRAPNAGAAYLAVSDDAQYVFILDENNQWLETLVWQRSNDQAWTSRRFDLTGYAGQDIKVHFGASNDGSDGVTAMYVDDVSLEICTAAAASQ